MQDIDWHQSYSTLFQLIGSKVKLDGGEQVGHLIMVLGGPKEIFYVIDIGGKFHYIDVLESHRVDLVA